MRRSPGLFVIRRYGFIIFESHGQGAGWLTGPPAVQRGLMGLMEFEC